MVSFEPHYIADTRKKLSPFADENIEAQIDKVICWKLPRQAYLAEPGLETQIF